MIFSKIVLVIVILLHVVHAQDIKNSDPKLIEVKGNKYRNPGIINRDGYDSRTRGEKGSGSARENNEGHQIVSYENTKRKAKRGIKFTTGHNLVPTPVLHFTPFLAFLYTPDIAVDDPKRKGHGNNDGYSEYNYDHVEGKKERESESKQNKNNQPGALRLHFTVLNGLSQKHSPRLGYESDDMQGKAYGVVTMKYTKRNGAKNRRSRRSGGNGFDPGEIGGYIILSHEIKSNDKGGRGIGDHYNGGILGGYDIDGGSVYKNDGRGSNFAGGGNDGGKRSIEPTAGGKTNITTNNGNKPQSKTPFDSVKHINPSIRHNGNEIRNIAPAISVSNANGPGQLQTTSGPINGVGSTGPIGGARPIPINNVAKPQGNHGPITNNGNASNGKINPLPLHSLGKVNTNTRPVQTITAPVKTNEAAKIITGPVKTNAVPAKTITGPIKTNAVPAKTIIGPITTNAVPPKTITGPVKTNAAPAKTINGPVKTNAVPAKTITGPVKTNAVPAKIITGPVKTNAVPAKIITGPVKTNAAPAKTITGPVKTNNEPVKTNAVPAKTITGLVKTNNEPAKSQVLNSSTNNENQNPSSARPANGKDGNNDARKINPVVTSGIEISSSQNGGDKTKSNNGPISVQNGDAKKNVGPLIATKVNPTAIEHKPQNNKSQNGSAGGEKDGSLNGNKADAPIPIQIANNSTSNESKAKAISETKSSHKSNGEINVEPVFPQKSNITTKNADNVKKSSSGPIKSEKVNSTTTGKRNIGSIIGAKGNSTRITEVAGELLNSEKPNNGRRHVGATIGGKPTSIAVHVGNARRHIGSVIGKKNNNQGSNVSIEIGNTKRNIGSTIGDKTNSDSVITESGLLSTGKRHIGSVIGSKILPGDGQQISVNLKSHNQPSSVSHTKPHQDSSVQEVPLFDILSFR
ncbi:uncharacterized protein LOC130698433 isoform X2 [Daphnia carinata]|uniref:uncharacterized protein LOC130698433 isoform X2 n=1 Tax=Daphnia carinata TaxID=120202 RepID=UPI00257982B4|nr:uncharacterized protein LOC130698433 isoform X2 [Daphnia carinata]